jgi:hypothetical protein
MLSEKTLEILRGGTQGPWTKAVRRLPVLRLLPLADDRQAGQPARVSVRWNVAMKFRKEPTDAR